MYGLLEGAARTRRYPGPTPALLYCTCTPQPVGPESGRWCLTHTYTTLRMQNTMVANGREGVVGGFAANSEALGGSSGSGL